MQTELTTSQKLSDLVTLERMTFHAHNSYLNEAGRLRIIGEHDKASVYQDRVFDLLNLSNKIQIAIDQERAKVFREWASLDPLEFRLRAEALGIERLLTDPTIISDITNTADNLAKEFGK